MDGRMRIAEVARRSGFPAATLRWYEEVDVLTVDSRGVGLEVGAPADAQPVLASLFGAASCAETAR